MHSSMFGEKQTPESSCEHGGSEWASLLCKYSGVRYEAVGPTADAPTRLCISRTMKEKTADDDEDLHVLSDGCSIALSSL